MKIGFTTNLKRRISSLRTGAAVPIEIIGTIKCSADRESLLHKKFGRYREHGEWFRLEGDLAKYVSATFEEGRTATAHTAHKTASSN